MKFFNNWLVNPRWNIRIDTKSQFSILLINTVNQAFFGYNAYKVCQKPDFIKKKKNSTPSFFSIRV